MDLGVAGWPTGLPVERPTMPPRRADIPEDAPAWWDGENTNEFLAEQGIVLG